MNMQAVITAAETTPWHASPLVKQIIADLFVLEDMACRYTALAREAGDKWPNENETTRAIGTLEQGGGWRSPRTWNASGGLSRHLFDQLDGARDEWIEVEGHRIVKERGLSLAHDAPDEVQDEIETVFDDLRDAADTVNRAIDLAIDAVNARVAA